jgi:D-serine deaminase-like pyridoxal phosphate-dependent protein
MSLSALIEREPALRDTPVLTVDLEAVERNIARLQTYCDERGFAFRPHIKTHKLPAIAQMQVDAGATGITCQKIGEAEVMAAAGLSDILISYPIIGEEKALRLARLARTVRIGVVGDSATCALGVSEVLAREEGEVDFLVECDTGLGRTGVQTPGEAAELAELVDSLPALRFAGLMTYPTTSETSEFFRAAREAIRASGIEVETMSGGGTPGALHSHELGEITEIRAGTYIYGDRSCIANGSVPLEDCALRVVATVVSRPTRERAIIDAGSKTLTSDPVAGTNESGFGLIVEHPEAEIHTLNEEHGYVDISRCERPPEIGEIITIVPNHACGTTNMHDAVVAYRGGDLVATWPIAARGRVR